MKLPNTKKQDRKKATPQQLNEIKEKLQRQNKREFLITIVIISALFILLFILFNYVDFKIKKNGIPILIYRSNSINLN